MPLINIKVIKGAVIGLSNDDRMVSIFVPSKRLRLSYRLLLVCLMMIRHVKINGSPVSLTENSAVFRKTDLKKNHGF